MKILDSEAEVTAASTEAVVDISVAEETSVAEAEVITTIEMITEVEAEATTREEDKCKIISRSNHSR